MVTINARVTSGQTMQKIETLHLTQMVPKVHCQPEVQLAHIHLVHLSPRSQEVVTPPVSSLHSNRGIQPLGYTILQEITASSS